MSSPLSKVITDLAPAKAFYLPKCGGSSSKLLPPLWAGLIIHQLLIPLAHRCIIWLFLGKWATVAPVKWNSLLQSDLSSKLQFDCEIQWLIWSFSWLSYSNMFLGRMFLTVFHNWKVGIIFRSHVIDIKKIITHGIIISSLLVFALWWFHCSDTQNFLHYSKLSCWMYYTKFLKYIITKVLS